MEKEDRLTLLRISDTLDEILEVLKKPESKVERIFNIGAAVVGTLAIVHFLETILKWLSEG